MNVLTRKAAAPMTPAAAARAGEVQLIQARAAAELAQVRHDQHRAELARTAELAQLVTKQSDQDRATSVQRWTAKVQRWTALVVPFAPLVQVNLLAVYGQVGWGRDNLTQVGTGPDDLVRVLAAILFAATLESIALFLTYYANRAMSRRDSASALYLATFGVAALVASVNYSHYAGDVVILRLGPVDVGSPTAMAVVTALCSFASPWLWRIKHRDTNREELHRAGVIDPRAVRLSWARKLWHPVRSIQVMYGATWTGETNPATAVQVYTERRAERDRARRERQRQRQTAAAERQDQKVPGDVPGAKWPAVAITAPPVVPAAAATAPRAVGSAAGTPALPPAPVATPAMAVRFPAAWDVLVRTDTAGNRISQRQLATVHLSGNRHHASALIVAFIEWKGMTASAHAAHAGTARP